MAQGKKATYNVTHSRIDYLYMIKQCKNVKHMQANYGSQYYVYKATLMYETQSLRHIRNPVKHFRIDNSTHTDSPYTHDVAGLVPWEERGAESDNPPEQVLGLPPTETSHSITREISSNHL